MTILNIITTAILLLLVLDTDLRAHLWAKIHNMLAAITNAVHALWDSFTNKKGPPPPPPLSTPPTPPAS